VCCVEVREAATIHFEIKHSDWNPPEFLNWGVRASQPFELHLGNTTVALDPRVSNGIDRAHLAALLRLTRRGADKPRWDDDGRVVVPLESGSLVFPPHPTEASWTITGPWGQVWRCLPGGVVVDHDEPLPDVEREDERSLPDFALGQASEGC